jgi:hypothetical protein
VVGGVVHRDRGREHRIGWSQDGPEEHRHGQGETEQPVRHRRHADDGRQHRGSREPPRRHPGLVAERKPEPEPADKERHDHGDLGEPLEPCGGFLEVYAQPAEAQRPDGEAQQQVDGGRGDRQAADIHGRQAHEEQQSARERDPSEEAHL